MLALVIIIFSFNSDLVSPLCPNPHSSLKWIGELARHLETFQGFQVSGYGAARDTNRF
jgi:ABC-type spermidine/putrescine transport system permease subunit II